MAKKYSQKKPPPDYTGIEGGGFFGESGQEPGTAGVAAGKSLPGRCTTE